MHPVVNKSLRGTRVGTGTGLKQAKQAGADCTSKFKKKVGWVAADAAAEPAEACLGLGGGTTLQHKNNSS